MLSKTKGRHQLVVAYLALFVALGGSAVAAKPLIDGSDVADESLTAADIQNNTIGSDEIASSAVQSDEVAANSLTAADIADGSIEGAEVVDGGLRAPDIARFTGTLTLNFGIIADSACASVASTTLTPLVASDSIQDDVIVVSPAASFPSDGVTMTAKAIAPAQISVTLCNISGGDLNVGERTLRFLSIDVD